MGQFRIHHELPQESSPMGQPPTPTSSSTDEQARQGNRLAYADAIRAGNIIAARALAADLGLGEGELSAHLLGDQLWDNQRPNADFDDYPALAPGRFDTRVLEQGKVWVDVLRRPHDITDRDDFTDDYLLAVVSMCRQSAWRWATIDYSAALGPDGLRGSAQTALDQTPLMQALFAEARRRGLTLPDLDE